ncbi:MAG: alpha/beta hydrolase [Rhodobacteraceae bacterium]|nr:alpha/beta hydrolase [Paracoccaceae bacterium]
MAAAPFYVDVADAPDGVLCRWLQTSDAVRIRAASWHKGDKGTVLLFPGRTECIEKYGPAAAEFAKRGYSMATLDWRGQGLADRLIADPDPGHVGRFSDYQLDVAAFVEFARSESLPEPFFLVCHSMGGCIGLRALHEGIGVRAVAFSAPMWGIRIHPLMRPIARSMSSIGTAIGYGNSLVPSTSRENYVVTAGFAGNVLTRDEAMYNFIRRQVVEHPDLSIGGPTLQWLHEALLETDALRRMASPDYACITMLGLNERIVDTAAIQDRMTRWPGADFILAEGAEHELMMEGPAIRTRFYDAAAALFGKSAG